MQVKVFYSHFLQLQLIFTLQWEVGGGLRNAEKSSPMFVHLAEELIVKSILAIRSQIWKYKLIHYKKYKTLNNHVLLLHWRDLVCLMLFSAISVLIQSHPPHLSSCGRKLIQDINQSAHASVTS